MQLLKFLEQKFVELRRPRLDVRMGDADSGFSLEKVQHHLLAPSPEAFHVFAARFIARKTCRVFCSRADILAERLFGIIEIRVERIDAAEVVVVAVDDGPPVTVHVRVHLQPLLSPQPTDRL